MNSVLSAAVLLVGEVAGVCTPIARPDIRAFYAPPPLFGAPVAIMIAFVKTARLAVSGSVLAIVLTLSILQQRN